MTAVGTGDDGLNGAPQFITVDSIAVYSSDWKASWRRQWHEDQSHYLFYATFKLSHHRRWGRSSACAIVNVKQQYITFSFKSGPFKEPTPYCIFFRGPSSFILIHFYVTISNLSLVYVPLRLICKWDLIRLVFLVSPDSLQCERGGAKLL